MKSWRLIISLIVPVLLSACAGQPGAPAARGVAADAAAQAMRAGDLPCAVSESGEEAAIGYPVESLYRTGAALPTREGLACLEGLAGWLKAQPQGRWQVAVSGEDGQGFDPLALAEKRRELLQRFFARKGLEMNGWQWQTVAGGSNQLRLAGAKAAP